MGGNWLGLTSGDWGPFDPQGVIYASTTGIQVHVLEYKYLHDEFLRIPSRSTLEAVPMDWNFRGR